MVYDVTKTESFDEIDNFWLQEVTSYAESYAKLVLLGNKSDEAKDRQVETSKGEAYAKKNKM